MTPLGARMKGLPLHPRLSRMRQRNIGWRLDYVLASQPIFDTVQSCVIQREFGTSDHGPVIATFGL